jgi:hypothetical protein
LTAMRPAASIHKNIYHEYTKGIFQYHYKFVYILLDLKNTKKNVKIMFITSKNSNYSCYATAHYLGSLLQRHGKVNNINLN